MILSICFAYGIQDEYNEEFSRLRNFFKYSEVTQWLKDSKSNYYELVDPKNDTFDYYKPT